ncbi:putative methyltransferase C9orf114 homolog isoform X1 [Argopecten irradians]|uniref:putative methyltransferase C9orf114 homolog isoform X1 n=2 Tax=Argopecten irradians TaxID=31199 RepID=UPI003718533B
MPKSLDKKSSYEKDVPSNPKDWKKWKEERKRQKRKWKEEALIKKLEKEQQRKKNEEEQKNRAMEEEKVKERLGVQQTISIALPGSILDNAQSPELRTYLAGQIARSAVIFNVDEIVIFDETGSTNRSVEGQYDGVGKKGQANVQLARILQYLECPQYLRKSFFPQHKDLQYAGLLNPLDSPHHMRADEKCYFREGVVLNKPVATDKGSYVNVGLLKEVQIDKQIQPGVRVTVKLNELETEKKNLKGKVVSPSLPKVEGGLYWGYQVRLASSIGNVFTECPYKDGYDLTIGTSEKGDCVDTMEKTKYRHCLVVFGGVKGLECSLEADEALEEDDPSALFQHYLNTCPHQGSGTIRTEEAILITMSALRPVLSHTDS